MVCRSAPFLSRLITLELYERIDDCCTVDRKASPRGLGRVHQQSNGKFIQRRAAVFVSGLSSKQPTDEYRGAIEEMRRKSVQWISIRPDGVAPSAAERRNITRKKKRKIGKASLFNHFYSLWKCCYYTDVDTKTRRKGEKLVFVVVRHWSGKRRRRY